MKYNIKLGFFGNISVGKSTLVNAILANNYCETSMRRCTAGMVYYNQIMNKVGKDDSNILEKSKNMNTQLRTENKIEEANFDVCMNKFVKFDPRVQLTLVDTPGLNEVDCSQIYTNYIKDTFNIFDVVIYVVDVKDAMGTQQEKDIFNLLLECKKKTNKEVKFIVVVNKADDLEDTEIQTMIHQTKNMIRKLTKGHIKNVPVIPICSEAAYICRGIHYNDIFDKLDIKHINKIGMMEYGKTKWKKINVNAQRKMVYELLSNEDVFNERMKECNFNKFMEICEGIRDKQMEVLVEQVMHIFRNADNYKDIEKCYNQIIQITHDFGSSETILNTETLLNKFLEIYQKIYMNNDIYKTCKSDFALTNEIDYIDKVETGIMNDMFNKAGEYLYNIWKFLFGRLHMDQKCNQIIMKEMHTLLSLKYKILIKWGTCKSEELRSMYQTILTIMNYPEISNLFMNELFMFQNITFGRDMSLYMKRNMKLEGLKTKCVKFREDTVLCHTQYNADFIQLENYMYYILTGKYFRLPGFEKFSKKPTCWWQINDDTDDTDINQASQQLMSDSIDLSFINFPSEYDSVENVSDEPIVSIKIKSKSDNHIDLSDEESLSDEDSSSDSDEDR
jgi:small GTP-binding protein